MSAYSNKEARVFFVDGLGGTGKMYVENLILKSIRANGHIALAVASSGIAALLLDGGRTAHSTFKIPLCPNPTSVCNISKKTHLHELLKCTRLILWDEAPMTNSMAFEAVNRTLRDLLDRDVIFGGIPFVKSRDFRQILPVVPKGTRKDIIRASLKHSFLWAHTEKMHLTQNMGTMEACCTLDDYEGINFAAWLLKLGNDELQKFDDEWIVCPRMMLLENQTLRGLIDAIYPRTQLGKISKEFLAERAILATKNDEVRSMNEEILTLLPGEAHSYLSADSTQDYEVQEDLPIEFLHSLELNGLPSHRLNLKVGAPVILLRNIDPSQGFYNGSRLIVKQLGLHVIQAEILMGQAAGSVVFIPWILLLSKQSGLPFVLKRKQFPLRLSYVMTINKAQGQTFSFLGLDLRNEVFSHGQLYVAFSRCKSPLNIKVLLPNNEKGEKGLMRNIVFDEAIR